MPTEKLYSMADWHICPIRGPLEWLSCLKLGGDNPDYLPVSMQELRS